MKSTPFSRRATDFETLKRFLETSSRFMVLNTAKLAPYSFHFWRETLLPYLLEMNKNFTFSKGRQTTIVVVSPFFFLLNIKNPFYSFRKRLYSPTTLMPSESFLILFIVPPPKIFQIKPILR